MDVVKKARECLKLAIEADDGNRDAAINDLRFASGEQWPAEIQMQRQLDRRPCLTINKTDTFVRSVVNNMRQQRPRIKVHPVGFGADDKVAQVIQGLVRHIEVNSNAELAYDTAADFQVRMGWGYWRIRSDYIAEDSFDQELYIERIQNPFTVYMDPSATMPDGSDAQWVLITERVKRDKFKKQYPKADAVEFGALGAGDEGPQWATKDEVTVAEYYWIEETPDTLVALSNGARIFKSQMPADAVLQYAGVQVVGERESVRKAVKWAKLTGREILEQIDQKGKYIPVVRVTGAELNVDGRMVRFGMVRQLKDPQRMYNFWRTAETEVVALAPKAPWLIAEGQDEGWEDEWATANQRSYSSLKWKPTYTDDGQLIPPPQRLEPQQIPAAHVNAAMVASEDLKAVAGMFDPSLGAPGNETSGRMVQARQGQSDLSNYHFYDNLTQSIRHTGKILLDLIPHYYDTQRVIRIIGEDGTPDGVTINEQTQTNDGVQKVLNDVRVGLYDVVMDTGPGYQTKRQETAEALLNLLGTELGKTIGTVAGDVLMRQFDFPGADMVADRLEAANPLAQATKQLPPDTPDDAKAIIMHLMTQNQQMQQQLQQLGMEKQAKVFGEQVKQQGEMQREQLRQQHENRRLLAKEHAESERNSDDNRTWVETDLIKAHEKRFEAVLDAQTDIRLAKDRPPYNEPA